MGLLSSEQADTLRRDLETTAGDFDVDIRLWLVLPNKVNTRTRLVEEYLDAFRSEYPAAVASDIDPYS